MIDGSLFARVVAGAVFPFALAMFAPFLLAIVARTRAVMVGRAGPPLLQPYRDLAKLLRKGSVTCHTATYLFRLGPLIALAAVGSAYLIVPIGPGSAPLAFVGDAILLAGLLALGRFMMALAALDTASSFPGMGAARETTFGALGEPAFMLALLVLARSSGELSLSFMLAVDPARPLAGHGYGLVLVAASLFLLLLAENNRGPVHDPSTHLELTMVHEVMILDHSGPDLAIIQAGVAARFALQSAILVRLLAPAAFATARGDLAVFSFVSAALALALGCAAIAVAVGLVESTFARLRLAAVPLYLVSAGALSLFALILGGR